VGQEAETAKLADSLARADEYIRNDEIMSAAKAAMRGGTSVTDELAKRGYVPAKRRRDNKCYGMYL
jgi:hypothetical protein